MQIQIKGQIRALLLTFFDFKYLHSLSGNNARTLVDVRASPSAIPVTVWVLDSYCLLWLDWLLLYDHLLPSVKTSPSGISLWVSCDSLYPFCFPEPPNRRIVLMQWPNRKHWQGQTPHRYTLKLTQSCVGAVLIRHRVRSCWECVLLTTLTESWWSAEGRTGLCWWFAACCRTVTAGWGSAGPGRCWLSNSWFCWHSAAWDTKEEQFSVCYLSVFVLLFSFISLRAAQTKINTHKVNEIIYFLGCISSAKNTTFLSPVVVFPHYFFPIASSTLSTHSWLYFLWPWHINLKKIVVLFIFTFSLLEKGGECLLLGGSVISCFDGRDRWREEEGGGREKGRREKKDRRMEMEWRK